MRRSGGVTIGAVALMLVGTTALASAQGPTREALIAAARDIMTSARYCSVLTVGGDGRPQARVVDTFAPEADMTVWFATNPASRKVADLRRDDRVTLHCFDARAPENGYVTLFGRGRLVDDPAEKAKRWKPGWEAFWPDRGAGYLLVAITPERLEVVSPKRGIDGDPRTWQPPGVLFMRSDPAKFR